MSEYDFLAAFDEEDTPTPKPTRGQIKADEPAEKKGIGNRLHLPELLIAVAIAILLAVVPIVAHADTGSSAASTATSSSAATSNGNASASAKSSSKTAKSTDGFAVSDKKTKLASGKTIKTKNDNARGIVAANGAAIIAGNLKVATFGDCSPTLVAADETSGISLVSSKLKTLGNDSPLISCSGTIEVENVKGTATSSPIAELVNAIAVTVSNSTLTSQYEGIAESNDIMSGITNAVTSGNTNTVTGGIVIAGAESTDSGTAADASASESSASTSSESASGTSKLSPTQSSTTTLLQIVGSTINSSINTGALFYLTNVQAKVVLDNTELDFDSSTANLITAAGNNVDGWGTSGKNGANATFTCYGEQLVGNVSVDAISSLDFYLLEGTTWKGSSDINSSTTGETTSENLNVNIDATSGWALTEDSTVTSLNLESGAKLVDENGDAVKIVDADGNTLVDGASDIKVEVRGSFSTSITTTSANELESSTIKRDAYDEKFSASTTFGTNGEATSPSVEDKARELAVFIKEWFDNL